jgi:DNA-binding IclR family transcriptional regulator
MPETSDSGAAKLVALLEALADVDSDGRDGLSVAELARALGRDKSVISRQLKPLVALGLVERHGEGRHSLGWRLFAIAAHAGDQRLLLLAPPVMRRLTQLLRERVHFSIRRGTDVLTILSESPRRTVEAVGWVGRTSPLTCTSSGRALLFDHSDEEVREMFASDFPRGAGAQAPGDVDELLRRLRTARQEGVAYVENEFDDDLSGVAAPVRDVHGRIVAALNVSAPTFRLRDHRVPAGRSLLHAANHLSALLSAPPDAREA